MNPIVETASGKIRGATIDGVAAFRGVPYGASTAGAARFMPPRPPRPGPACATRWTMPARRRRRGSGRHRGAEMVNFSGPPDGSPETEDCLTLNVWTPGAGQRGEAAGDGVAAWRGVFVWLVEQPAAARHAAVPARRRCAGDGEPAAEHLRPSRSVAVRRRGVRAVGQRRHARHDRRAALGARQHRGIRRRSRLRDDLRRVGRRRKSQHAAGDAVGAWLVPPRHRAERRRGAAAHARSCRAS